MIAAAAQLEAQAGAQADARAGAAIHAQDRARAELYGLLANLFYAPPAAALLRRLGDAGELAAEAPDAPLPRAWRALVAAARHGDAGVIAREYDDAFVGVGRAPVLLYGSYYLAGALNERPLARLREDLARLGLARKSGVPEPEDHVAALCDAMRELITRRVAQDDAAAREAVHKEFFMRHVAPWYGQLCAAIDAAPGTDFYRGVAAFARAFLDLENEFLNMI